MRYRTTVTNSGSTSYYDYVWDSDKLVSMVYTSGNTSQTAKYLYGSSDEVIGIVITDSNNSISTYYYLRNAQGDITGIVNSSGKKIISYTYDVFGNCTETYHSTTTAENTKYLQVNVLNPFAYRGYCYDSDMGLYYLQSRYYDPNIGRFINADDTNYLNATGTVLSCNLFTYCENDPVNYSDGFGNFSVKKANEVLVKILSNIKGAFFDYIFSLLKNEKGEPAIHTDIIAVVINTIIRVFLTKALVTAANSVLTVASKTYLKTHTGDAINIIKKLLIFLPKTK